MFVSVVPGESRGLRTALRAPGLFRAVEGGEADEEGTTSAEEKLAQVPCGVKLVMPTPRAFQYRSGQRKNNSLACPTTESVVWGLIMSDGSSTFSEGGRWDEELQRCERELEDISSEESALAARRSKVETKLKLLRQLAEVDSGEPLPEPARLGRGLSALLGDYAGAKEPSAKKERIAHNKPPKGGEPKVTWVAAVTAWVASTPAGMTHAELKSQMLSTEWGPKFRESEKGYYNALSRLQNRGVIKKHGNRLYTAEALDNYLKAVAQGRITEKPEAIIGSYSPMGEAVLDIVYRSRFKGVRAPDIVAELQNDVEFKATLTPHRTGAFNIIARLVRRKQIVKGADGICFPGPLIGERNKDSKWLKPSPVPSEGDSK